MWNRKKVFRSPASHVILKTRTADEYGIDEEELSLLTEAPPEVQEIVDVDSADLD